MRQPHVRVKRYVVWLGDAIDSMNITWCSTVLKLWEWTCSTIAAAATLAVPPVTSSSCCSSNVHHPYLAMFS
jgi:hypothetical protein